MSVNFDVVTVACQDCGTAFTLTATDREWFLSKGMNLPRRCKDCRRARRDARVQRDQISDGAR